MTPLYETLSLKVKGIQRNTCVRHEAAMRALLLSLLDSSISTMYAELL